MSAILILADREFRDSIRNRWILAIAALLAGLALTLSFLGSALTGTLGAPPLEVAVVSLASLSVFLIPLIALLLAFDAWGCRHHPPASSRRGRSAAPSQHRLRPPAVVAPGQHGKQAHGQCRGAGAAPELLAHADAVRQAVAALQLYEMRLTSDPPGAQFYARADNLREWLAVVEVRLGSLSQRLSASVGQVRVNTDLGGAPTGAATRDADGDVIVKTPWLDIDEVFYEARGTAWALLMFLRAAQFDFERTLEDKNAVVSLRQVIRELEEGLRPIRSPMILNGQGFGMFPNHSLVLASYLSRAHSAVADLRRLLEEG